MLIKAVQNRPCLGLFLYFWNFSKKSLKTAFVLDIQTHKYAYSQACYLDYNKKDRCL
jgi:hypothetical protein